MACRQQLVPPLIEKWGLKNFSSVLTPLSDFCPSICYLLNIYHKFCGFKTLLKDMDILYSSHAVYKLWN